MIKRRIAIVAMCLIAMAIFYKISQINSHQMDGEIELDLFDSPVTIYRDKYGVPYLFANSNKDLFKAQGYVVATDRVFQIEMYRALIQGRLASLIGEEALSSDIKMRVLDIPSIAQRQFKYLSNTDQKQLQWYADGYNAFIEQRSQEYPIELSLLGISPTPLTAQDILSIVNFAGFVHGKNYDDELLMQRIVNEIGPQKASLLLPLNINPDRQSPVSPKTSPQFPIQNLFEINKAANKLAKELPIGIPTLGSNNWVTSAQKSKSSSVIISNDPHLDARILPGPWYPIGLFSPEIKAVGANLPGLPGLLTGRTANLAFGVTNAYGDSQDLYIEVDSKQLENHYLDRDQPRPYRLRVKTISIKDSSAKSGYRTETIKVRSTIRGPVISDHAAFGFESSTPISLRWALRELQPGSLGTTRFLTAQNAFEFDRAVQDVKHLYLNFIFGDAQGNIGFRSSGSIPIRPNGAFIQDARTADHWGGYIPGQMMPGKINPQKGWLATSNHDVVPDNYPYYYSNHFSPYYRYQRTKEFLQSTETVDASDHWRLILDVKNKHAERLVPIFVSELSKSKDTKHLATLLSEWDYKDDIYSVGATIFHLIHEKLIRAIFEDDLNEALLEDFLASRYFWLQRTDKMIEETKSDFFDDLRTPEPEDFAFLLTQAARDSANQLRRLYGFNKDLGWANTVNHIDLVDTYRLKINPENSNQYKLDGQWRDFEVGYAEFKVKLLGPFMWPVKRKILRSVHGPVILNGDLALAVRYAGMGEIRQLEQYYRLNKSRNWEEFEAAMAMNALPSINYIYADKDDNIAFIHNAQYPARNDRWQWDGDMPGDDSSLVWQTYRPFDEIPMLLNPQSGLVFNANNTPFLATDGPDNLSKNDFPKSMGLAVDNTNRSFRLSELNDGKSLISKSDLLSQKFDIEYSKQSPYYQILEKVLGQDWSDTPALLEVQERIKTWDRKANIENRHTALPIQILRNILRSDNPDDHSPETLRKAAMDAVEYLQSVFGRVDPQWGQTNRLLRGDFEEPVNGGPDLLRAIYSMEEADDGRPFATHGDTWMAIVEWDSNGKQTAEVLHQFGSATLDRSSKHYADQAKLFVDQKWRKAELNIAENQSLILNKYSPYNRDHHR